MLHTRLEEIYTLLCTLCNVQSESTLNVYEVSGRVSESCRSHLENLWLFL